MSRFTPQPHSLLREGNKRKIDVAVTDASFSHPFLVRTLVSELRSLDKGQDQVLVKRVHVTPPV